MSFQRQALEAALRSFGAILQNRKTPYGLLIVGGSNLLLLGLIDRPTADIDVIGLSENGRYRKIVELPEPLMQAAADVQHTFGLSQNWINTAPASLMDLGLPPGWEERVEIRRFGALELHLTSRYDQICFKLYAAVDRGPNDKHFVDLNALDPTEAELLTAANWTTTHDPSPDFRSQLLQVLRALGVEVDHGDL